MSERSSIMLLGRNSVIIGALLITIASFGIGYFFGYKGNSSPVNEKQAVENANPGEVLPAEDKKVIELPAPHPTPAKPDQAAATPPQKTEEQANAKTKVETAGAQKSSAGAADSSDKPDKPDKNISDTRKSAANITVAQANKAQDDTAGQQNQNAQAVQSSQAAPASQGGNAPVKRGGRHAREKAIKKAKSRASAGKVYTVQVGAFPSKEGADQLYQNLKASGYAPYIVNAKGSGDYFKVRVGTFKNKQAAEKSALALLKKTGLHNFVTVAQ